MFLQRLSRLIEEIIQFWDDYVDNLIHDKTLVLDNFS